VSRIWAAWEKVCDHLFPQETAEDINRHLLAHARRQQARHQSEVEYHVAMAGLYAERITRITNQGKSHERIQESVPLRPVL
jgi:hypothetical protein